MLTPGTVLAGKYRIDAAIAEGGYGKVYLGEDLDLGRQVAIKELLQTTTENETGAWDAYRERFRKEARIVSQFSHPHVVGAYALEKDPAGNLYLVLEYVDAGSLKQRLEHGAPLDIDLAIGIAIDICQAIEAIYSRDIVHRDIKPSNILLSSSGQAKLTDFGVAQVGDETRRTQDSHPHPGTPAYKSPEQAESTRSLDQRSDLYALGLVLYEMLTGHAYHHNHLAPRHNNPSVPSSLDAIVTKALQEEPAKRYQSAAELQQDLEYVRDQRIWQQLRIMWSRVDLVRVATVAGLVVLIALTGGVFRLASVLSSSQSLAALSQDAVLAQASAEATTQAMPEVGPSPTDTESPTPPLPTEDIYEPDDLAPVEISVGEMQQRSFNPADDVDRVTFRAKAGRTYIISTSNLAVGVDSRLEVVVNGQTYTNDDVSPGTLASQVVLTAQQDAMAVVTILNTDQFGASRTYDLSVMAVSPTPTASLPEARVATEAPRATYTPRPTFTPMGVRSSTPNAGTPTLTRTPTITRTPTSTRTATPTRTTTPTRTPTLTRTLTLTPAPSATPVPTATPIPVYTPLPVKTDEPPGI
ncbi:MAG: serine/threonine-protein kinase [Anaerolineae bacterium]